MQLIEKLNILKFTITSTRLIITSEEQKDGSLWADSTTAVWEKTIDGGET